MALMSRHFSPRAAGPPAARSSAAPHCSSGRVVVVPRRGRVAARITSEAAAERAEGGAAPAPTAAPASLADVPNPASQRGVGCLVGGAAGASIGLSVEPERHFRITRLFPEGLTDPWRFRMAAGARAAPGDFAAAVAAAHCLADGGGADAGPLLGALAASYDPELFEYTPYTRLVLDALWSGADPAGLARQADDFLNLGSARCASTSSDRFGRQPFGAADAGAALRAAPLGVACAAAGRAELEAAVDGWTLFSHPTEEGRDGALAAAAAAAWLAAAPDADAAGPEALLDALEEVVTTDAMRSNLATVKAALSRLGQLPEIPAPSAAAGGFGSWREFWGSEQWGRVVEAHGRLSDRGFATLAPQAVGVALLALALNWRRPQQAVALAAALGGNASTTAALTGAFAGSLHGCGWIPQRWWEALGESEAERAVRDDALDAGLRLPRL